MSNIFQVVNADDLEEILDDNLLKLVVVMFSSKQCLPCKNIKPVFIELSKKNSDCFFVYIDLTNFKDNRLAVTESIEGTPQFIYYYDKQEIANVVGGDKEVLVNTFNSLNDKIVEKHKEAENSSFKQPTAEDMAKMDLLERLCALTRHYDVVLTKPLSMESTYDEVKEEYDFHMAELNKPSSAEIPEEDEDVEKIAQIKKIQELNNLNQMNQMKELYKLQQLKQMKMMKEKQEQGEQ